METASIAKNGSGKINLWQQILGHINGVQLGEMIHKKTISGFDDISPK